MLDLKEPVTNFAEETKKHVMMQRYEDTIRRKVEERKLIRKTQELSADCFKEIDKYVDALVYHEEGTPGKYTVKPNKAMGSQVDLSLAYSPGVAAPC